MAGKGRVYSFMILAIVVLAVAGCPSPLGSISGGRRSGSDVSDSRLVVLGKMTYNVGESFRRTDLQVYTIYGEQWDPVPIYECKIGIADPYDSSNLRLVDAVYTFTNVGTKRIVVEHNGSIAQYNVEVLLNQGNPTEPTNPTNPTDPTIPSVPTDPIPPGSPTSGDIVIVW